MPEAADRWLSVAETAARLRIHPTTLRVWRHRGIGPLGALIGGWHKYLESDVIAWEKERRRIAQAERDRWTPAGQKAS